MFHCSACHVVFIRHPSMDIRVVSSFCDRESCCYGHACTSLCLSLCFQSSGCNPRDLIASELLICELSALVTRMQAGAGTASIEFHLESV